MRMAQVKLHFCLICDILIKLFTTYSAKPHTLGELFFLVCAGNDNCITANQDPITNIIVLNIYLR